MSLSSSVVVNTSTSHPILEEDDLDQKLQMKGLKPACNVSELQIGSQVYILYKEDTHYYWYWGIIFEFNDHRRKGEWWHVYHEDEQPWVNFNSDQDWKVINKQHILYDGQFDIQLYWKQNNIKNKRKSKKKKKKKIKNESNIKINKNETEINDKTKEENMSGKITIGSYDWQCSIIEGPMEYECICIEGIFHTNVKTIGEAIEPSLNTIFIRKCDVISIGDQSLMKGSKINFEFHGEIIQCLVIGNEENERSFIRCLWSSSEVKSTWIDIKHLSNDVLNDKPLPITSLVGIDGSPKSNEVIQQPIECEIRDIIMKNRSESDDHSTTVSILCSSNESLEGNVGKELSANMCFSSIESLSVVPTIKPVLIAKVKDSNEIELSKINNNTMIINNESTNVPINYCTTNHSQYKTILKTPPKTKKKKRIPLLNSMHQRPNNIPIFKYKIDDNPNICHQCSGVTSPTTDNNLCIFHCRQYLQSPKQLIMNKNTNHLKRVLSTGIPILRINNNNQHIENYYIQEIHTPPAYKRIKLASNVNSVLYHSVSNGMQNTMNNNNNSKSVIPSSVFQYRCSNEMKQKLEQTRNVMSDGLPSLQMSEPDTGGNDGKCWSMPICFGRKCENKKYVGYSVGSVDGKSKTCLMPKFDGESNEEYYSRVILELEAYQTAVSQAFNAVNGKIEEILLFVKQLQVQSGTHSA